MDRHTVESMDPYDMELDPEGIWVMFDDVQAAIDAAVAAECERCANACKAVEAKYEASGWQYANDLANVADECERGILGPNV